VAAKSGLIILDSRLLSICFVSEVGTNSIDMRGSNGLSVVFYSVPPEAGATPGKGTPATGPGSEPGPAPPTADGVAGCR